MKPSRYNVFVHYEPDNAYIGFNCISGGLYVFNSDQYREAQNILSGKEDNSSSQIRKILIEGRYLITEDTDEIKILQLRNNLTRFNPVDLALVIAPTLFCNFNCPYCYVDRKKVVMTKEVIEALKKFFLSRIDRTHRIDITWTGGEPLLAANVIEELELFFQEKAKEKSVPYSSRMITNGYLLKPDMVQRLKKINLKWFQITIDGNKDFHNKFRYTKDDSDTYQTIIENVVYATNNDIMVALRSNISKDNYLGIFQLIDDLISYGVNSKKCMFIPCMITELSEANKPSTCNVFNNEEFSKLESEIILYSLKKGFGFIDKKLATAKTHCGANTLPLLVIDSHANVLKCWCNLGRADKNKVGRINENGECIIMNHNALANWMAIDPFSDNLCLNCNILPLCMGGCIYYQVTNGLNTSDDRCCHLKYNIESILKLLYISKAKTIEELKQITLGNIGGLHE